MNILADASLPGLSQAFPKPFELTLYHHAAEIPTLLKDQQILLCRAALKVNEALLTEHLHSLRYIATASSGTDHIDATYLTRNAIGLIDAKGSNATAVADYVIATLAFLQKYQDFSGLRAGVVGVGEAGSRVVKRLKALGMSVLCYDPLKAEFDSSFANNALDALTDCDLITVHANLHESPPFPSRDLFNETLFEQLKPGTVIVNASRGGIVDEKALLKQRKPLIYCTDVYHNEPSINKGLVEFAILCTPHIAGHSIEAKYKAISMLSEKLHRCFNLEPPAQQRLVVAKPLSTPQTSSWQDLVLSLYNPLRETTLLKAAANLELSFQNLRKAHQNRHDFCKYEIAVSQQIREILGG